MHLFQILLNVPHKQGRDWAYWPGELKKIKAKNLSWKDASSFSSLVAMYHQVELTYHQRVEINIPLPRFLRKRKGQVQQHAVLSSTGGFLEKTVISRYITVPIVYTHIYVYIDNIWICVSSVMLGPKCK